jgi:hypothetical protein
VEEFKYLGSTLKVQNSVQEEIQNRLNSGNARCCSVQNRLSSSLISKNMRTKIFRSIIFPVVLYRHETCLFTLREERRPRVFECRLLRNLFGPNRDKVTGE